MLPQSAHVKLLGSETPGSMSVAGLFAGIGGLELGFTSAGAKTALLCEIDPAAQVVLGRAFPDIPLVDDVRLLRALPRVDAVVAGFPCQNLSLVGSNEGIFGEQSGLVNEVFRLIAPRSSSPKWVVLENVPFMLWHKGGHAVRYITDRLSRLGFTWAYRVVDARTFGLPQRRRRVFIVASRTEDPREVLFADEAEEASFQDDGVAPCGFYWTEGRGGLGWAINGVPTLKGGSALGIPSPPAIWQRDTSRLATPDLRDAERLQGFDADWTSVSIADKPLRLGHRWKLVGNAVSVPVATWLGKRLASPGHYDNSRDSLWERAVWPDAAWGYKDKVSEVVISEYPEHHQYQGLNEFLRFPTKPLSAKATSGFLARAKEGRLRFADGFLEAVATHLRQQAAREASLKARIKSSVRQAG